MPSSHLILCRPLLLLPPTPPSIRVFSNESTLRMRWPKYWSFSFSISPSNEHPGLTSFRMDWLDLLAVQGTLKSLLQHHSSKASVFQHSAFFTVQISHLYMTTGKTIALTRWTTLLGHNLKFLSIDGFDLLIFWEGFLCLCLWRLFTIFPYLKCLWPVLKSGLLALWTKYNMILFFIFWGCWWMILFLKYVIKLLVNYLDCKFLFWLWISH